MVKVVLSFLTELLMQPSKKTEMSCFEGAPKLLAQDGASLAVVEGFAFFSPYIQESTSC